MGPGEGDFTSEPHPLAEGDPLRIADYPLTGVLGSGGQGVVYLSRTPLGRPVAVKTLHARMAGDDLAQARFLRETEIARRVAAFCTARVLDAGIAGGRPYLVSEYVQGPSLERLVTREGPRAGGGLDRLAITTLMALQAIHRAGVVHRDFKPGNVIMGQEGPVVIDFGIARALEHSATTSGLVGTPAYMSPELLGGAVANVASDVFAWAATMVYAARAPGLPRLDPRCDPQRDHDPRARPDRRAAPSAPAAGRLPVQGSRLPARGRRPPDRPDP
ncbi:serine/threonine-protein kinase [Nonomuraea sp. NPDC050540]|uniref:serine/threonine-protein kinase n=1 Tax=Nonomuraea sp. NPDC050540 TaxID=3364367 RepID=UPI0037883934